MGGTQNFQAAMFSDIGLEERVPAQHPLRKLRAVVDALLASMSAEFEAVYARRGRPSVPPEMLFKALLLPILFSIRSKRLLVQAIDDNLLDRWFVGLNLDFKGQTRSNDTHASTTDADARLFKKAQGDQSRLCHMGHILMENRNGLMVDVQITHAGGTAKRQATLKMLARQKRQARRLTVRADKGYDGKALVQGCRKLGDTPHVAAKAQHSAMDGRTTRHQGYKTSLRVRKRIEEALGWTRPWVVWPGPGSSGKPGWQGRRCCAWPRTTWCAWAPSVAGGTRIMRNAWPEVRRSGQKGQQQPTTRAAVGRKNSTSGLKTDAADYRLF